MPTAPQRRPTQDRAPAREAVLDLIAELARELHGGEAPGPGLDDSLERAVGDVEGSRTGCVAAFGVRAPGGATERLVVVAEARADDPRGREALRRRVAEAAYDARGVPVDEVVIAPPTPCPRPRAARSAAPPASSATRPASSSSGGRSGGRSRASP